MKKEPNKKAIGLFLVVGFALFFGLIGQSVLRKLSVDDEGVFVMYFDESLQGLSEGAPIVFHGVEVGKVMRIKLVADMKDLRFQVPVYARLKPMGIVEEDSFWKKIWSKDDVLETLIKRGLRARLTTQSLLTGQLMIELVMLPNSVIETKEEQGDKSFPQIPTVLSKSEEFSKGLDNLQIKNTLSQFNRVMDTLGEQLPILMPALSQSAENLNDVLSKVSENSNETISNLNKTLQDLSDAAKSLQNLTDYLEQHPEALIKGKKGE